MKHSRVILLLGGFLFANRIGAQTPSVPPVEDARLKAVVTLTEKEQPLAKVLQRLPQEAEKFLKASPEVGEERVMLFAHDLPLAKLQSGLSTLLNYPWTESEEKQKPPAWYRLASDGRARDYEATLRQQRLERGAAPLFRLTQYLRTPLETLQKRLEESSKGRPMEDTALIRNNLFYLQRPAGRAGLELLTTLSPRQRQTLLEEESCLLETNELNARQRELVTVMLNSLAANRGNPQTNKDPKGEALFEWVRDYGLWLDAPRDPLNLAVMNFTYRTGDESNFVATLPLQPQEADLLPVRGNPYRYRAGQRLPTYPELTKHPFPSEIPLTTGRVLTWGEVVQTLSKSLAYPLFSDAFGFMPTSGEWKKRLPPDLRPTNLVMGLDALCEQYGYCWWFQEGMLFFRSRNWFLEKEYEVPAAVLTALQKQLTTQGRLNTASLDILSRLTRKQLDGLNALAAVAQGGLTLAAANRDASLRHQGNSAVRPFAYLQIYAGLSTLQKRKALEEGVAPQELPPAQRRAFLTLLARCNFAQVRTPNRNLRFRISQLIESNGPERPPLVNLGFDGTLTSGLRVSCPLER